MSAAVPVEAAPGVAVVVATKDRPQLLAGLLDALVLRPQDELLVVDSGSVTSATREVCAARGVRCLSVGRPGTSLARNRGAAATTAGVLAFTDDDCLPAADWTAVAATIPADLMTGRVLPDRVVPAPVSLQLEEDAGLLDPAAPRGHGCNLVVRRVAYEAVGGFDERLGPGTPVPASEDGDLLRRLLAAGHTGHYEPALVVVHRQWRTRGQALRLSWSYGRGQAGAARSRGASTRPAWWDDGVLAALRDLRAGYLSGVLAGLLRALGALSVR